MMTIPLLVEQIAHHLLERNEILVTAESCTGGGIAFALTERPGSSQWFDRGYVTYSNQAKMELLEISEHDLNEHGAVSQVIAKRMAENALRLSKADWSIAVTGIAGPDGGSVEKPVGTVWIGWANQQDCHTQCFNFCNASRTQVRNQSIQAALHYLNYRLRRHP